MVTIAIMAECIKESIFQYTPVFRGKQFTSLLVIDHGDSIDDNTSSDSDSPLCKECDFQEDVLYVCDYETALAVSNESPRVWVLGVAGVDVAQLRQPSLECRLAFVRSRDSLLRFLARMQRLFLEMDAWQRETYDAILAGEGVQRILDIAEGIFHNYISLSNSNFELVARTKNIPIDDPKALELIEKGRHSEATIALFRAEDAMGDWERRSRVEERPPLLSGYPTLDYIYKRRGRYYMHLIMHCNNEAVSLGLSDKFQMLVDMIGLCVKQSVETDAFAGNDFSLLMEDAVLHRKVTPRAVEKRALAAGISVNEPKRLMVFSFTDSQYNRAYLSYYARTVDESFPWCAVGIYGRYVIALGAWGEDDERTLPALEDFSDVNPCSIGVSNAFTELSDLAFAFGQGKSALEEAANGVQACASRFMSHRHEAVFLFEDYFAQCAMSVISKNDLVRLSAQRGTVACIARFDEQHGTDDLRVLFVYLKNERDARKTSEELFIHRSTLLYRVNRMQMRFSFDLNDCLVRQRLMLEYYLCERGVRGEHAKKKE